MLAIGIAFSATVSVAAAATTEADTDYILFHHHDALGSTVATTDEQGRVLWYENSNPYGESRGRHSAEGRALDPSASFGTTNERLDTERPPLGYAGHVRDGGSDLIYMQQRHYDPVLGRFLSNDPVGFQASNPMMFNRYAYANNNPYGFVDPDGRYVESLWDGLNVALGVASFGSNISAGNYGAAALDGLGVVYDGIATALPILPGFAGASLKAKRAAKLAEDAAGTRKTAGGVGYTEHGLNQKINRNVPSSDVLDALNDPLKVNEVKVDHLGRPSQRTVGSSAEVVQNPETGDIVSVNPTSTSKAERLRRQRDEQRQEGATSDD